MNPDMRISMPGTESLRCQEELAGTLSLGAKSLWLQPWRACVGLDVCIFYLFIYSFIYLFIYFLPLTVFIIHLEIVEVIGEYVSTVIKSQSLTLFRESFLSPLCSKCGIMVNILEETQSESIKCNPKPALK